MAVTAFGHRIQGSSLMSPGPDSSHEEIHARLASAHAAKFGARADDALAAALDATAQAIAVISSQPIGAYGVEPDFITGSSESEAAS